MKPDEATGLARLIDTLYHTYLAQVEECSWFCAIAVLTETLISLAHV